MAQLCAVSAEGLAWSVVKFHWHEYDAPSARAVHMVTGLARGVAGC